MLERFPSIAPLTSIGAPSATSIIVRMRCSSGLTLPIQSSSNRRPSETQRQHEPVATRRQDSVVRGGVLAAVLQAGLRQSPLGASARHAALREKRHGPSRAMVFPETSATKLSTESRRSGQLAVCPVRAAADVGFDGLGDVSSVAVKHTTGGRIDTAARHLTNRLLETLVPYSEICPMANPQGCFR